MNAASSCSDESGSILVPEEILKSLLGVADVDLISKTLQVADENSRIVKPISDGYWQFTRKNQ